MVLLINNEWIYPIFNLIAREMKQARLPLYTWSTIRGMMRPPKDSPAM